MSIAQNIKYMQDEIKRRPQKGVELKALAVEAITGGFGSKGWIAYMQEFAKTPAQLRRLTTRETDCNDYTEPARAYLIGHGVCLPITQNDLLQGIEGFLDVTLQETDTEPVAAEAREPRKAL